MQCKTFTVIAITYENKWNGANRDECKDIEYVWLLLDNVCAYIESVIWNCVVTRGQTDRWDVRIEGGIL